MTDNSSARCSPSIFYTHHQSQKAFDVLDAITPYISYVTTGLIVVWSPFLIISPFRIEKLQTLLRQIIAMVVLSDYINTITVFIGEIRDSTWKTYTNETNIPCSVVGFLINASFFWSNSWSLVLLCSVLINFYKCSATINRNKLFVVLNMTVWPFGVFVTSITYFHYPVAYNSTYLFSASCQPKYEFFLSDDGNDCLLAPKAKALLIAYYTISQAFILASQVVFGLIVYHAYKQWKAHTILASRVRSDSEENTTYVAAEYSHTVLINSIPFSITGVIYIVIFVPINVRQFYCIYNGPIRHTSLDFFLNLWFVSAGNFTALINIVFYGLMSKILRQEVKERLKRKAYGIWRRYDTEASESRGNVNSHQELFSDSDTPFVQSGEEDRFSTFG